MWWRHWWSRGLIVRSCEHLGLGTTIDHKKRAHASSRGYEWITNFSKNSFSSRILEYMIFSNLGSSRRQNQKSVFDWTSNNHIKYLKSKVACTLNVFGLFRNDSKVIRSKRFSKQFIRNCFLEHINQLKLSNLELLTWHHVI